MGQALLHIHKEHLLKFLGLPEGTKIHHIGGVESHRVENAQDLGLIVEHSTIPNMEGGKIPHINIMWKRRDYRLPIWDQWGIITNLGDDLEYHDDGEKSAG